jgi:hypothetical protein
MIGVSKMNKLYILMLFFSVPVFSSERIEISVVGDEASNSSGSQERSSELKFDGIRVEGLQSAPLEYTRQQIEEKNSKNRLRRVPSNFNEKSKHDIGQQRYFP